MICARKSGTFLHNSSLIKLLCKERIPFGKLSVDLKMQFEAGLLFCKCDNL